MASPHPFVGAKFFVRIWSPIENSIDTPYYGKYVVKAPKENLTTEDLAGCLLALMRERTPLRQGHLAMFQIYDRNGHEIPNPVIPAVVPDLVHQYMIVDHIPEMEDVALVDASRTPMDVMSVPFNGEI